MKLFGKEIGRLFKKEEVTSTNTIITIIPPDVITEVFYPQPPVVPVTEPDLFEFTIDPGAITAPVLPAIPKKKVKKETPKLTLVSKKYLKYPTVLDVPTREVALDKWEVVKNKNYSHRAVRGNLVADWVKLGYVWQNQLGDPWPSRNDCVDYMLDTYGIKTTWGELEDEKKAKISKIKGTKTPDFEVTKISK